MPPGVLPALTAALLLLPWVRAADVLESVCPTLTCRHTYGYAYEFYFGESAAVAETAAAAARFAGHTALTLQAWVRPYSVSSGVNQSLVSDYTVDAETGEQYNCGLYLVPFNDTTSTPAFFAGQYDTTARIVCLPPAPPTHTLCVCTALSHAPVLCNQHQSPSASWRSTSGTT